ncbi:SCAN box domain-containing protein [Trichonephila clavipes]|nr:SCAN box domain-containing protein [Trichonephila clavipes]
MAYLAKGNKPDLCQYVRNGVEVDQSARWNAKKLILNSESYVEEEAELAQVPKKDWVAYLLAVLPAVLSNMLARTLPKGSNTYDFVKYLTIEEVQVEQRKVEAMFLQTSKISREVLENYAHELNSYFTEWIAELQLYEKLTEEEHVESSVVDYVFELINRMKRCRELAIPTHGRCQTKTEVVNPNEQLLLKPYRMSPRQIEILKSEVNKMLELKIIEPGESDFTSPLILVEAQGKEAKALYRLQKV